VLTIQLKLYPSTVVAAPVVAMLAIGSGSHFRDVETGHFQLLMDHELAKALDQLGWFRD
jgi:hypothetical protein